MATLLSQMVTYEERSITHTAPALAVAYDRRGRELTVRHFRSERAARMWAADAIKMADVAEIEVLGPVESDAR